MSNPTPISQETVRFFLQYIIPLPQSPLPPHLLASPLLHRHHFLGLDPIQDPVGYLAWPSADNSRVGELLQSLAFQTLPTVCPISYTSDLEATYAHIRISPGDDTSSGLRLIFYWQPNAGWKYHNVALMPFPPSSYSSLLFRPIDAHNPTMSTADDNDDDDAYWGSYSQPEPLSDHHQPTKADDHQNSEDAYWAQYATVQGSGDSTLPSPLPPKRKLVQPYQLHTPEPVYNPLQPPSPNVLASRLRKLEARPESPPLIDDSTSASASIVITPLTDIEHNHHEQTPAAPDTQADLFLKQSIQGIYSLWKASHPHQPDTNYQELFLRLATQAISEA